MTKENKHLKFVFSSILFLAFLLLLELLSYLYLYGAMHGYIKSKLSFIYSPDFVVDSLSSKWLERYYKRSFDPILGWRPKPNLSGRVRANRAGVEWQRTNDEFGARTNVDFDPSLAPYVATFGDSFTAGDEVNDDETWQYYLSGILARYVANYGVGGYGTGQALLNFKTRLDEGLTPTFAILGITEENFKRTLNRFRPFYHPGTGLKLGFKPRPYLDRAGNLSFLPSALTEEVYDRDRLIELIELSRTNDFWADYRPSFGFPYSVTLARAAYLRLCKKMRLFPTCESGQEPTWNSSEVRSIMTAVIEEFIRVSHNHDIRPIILFFSFRNPGLYASYLDELRKEYGAEDVLFIDVVEAGLDSSIHRVTPKRGHLSPRGNEFVGKHISRVFSDLGSQ